MTLHQLPDEVSGPIIATFGLVVSILFQWIYIETAIQACIAAVVSVVVGYFVKKWITKIEKWVNGPTPK